ncbi:hypothetical protein [Puerhibacterium sp. TATVAM-FAB25]|uniref:hypothetical protein n=1 Tax=Puerhibacterium sp. TATVAM-FAB25 TaxID=3093699 RepID=UPI00397D4C70
MTAQQQDEDFGRELRELADAVVPRIDVRTARVVPAARRRRARRRAATGVGALTAVVVAAGWTVQAQPWAPGPEQTAVLQVASSPTPSPPTEAGWPDAPYWYVRSEIASTSSSGDLDVVVSEHWYGHTEPGLWFEDGDTSAPTASGPAAWGRFMVDGADTLIGWDELYELPTDPDRLEQILRDSVEEGRSVGTPDDKVAEMALELLDASPAPPALRDAAWHVITGLPGTTVLEEATDAAGRTGVGATRTVEGTTYRLVYDADEHRLLERANVAGAAMVQDVVTGDLDVTSRKTYLEERPASAPPIEPTLEMAGCARWENC